MSAGQQGYFSVVWFALFSLPVYLYTSALLGSIFSLKTAEADQEDSGQQHTLQWLLTMLSEAGSMKKRL